ncbi:MAG TPA: hypothetical protein VJR92_16380 [Gemmatimonadaceae bacterium]|nr:hypothetical protein [Gemmatimonadaceae bacterium]
MRRRLPLISFLAVVFTLSGCMNTELETRQWDEIQQLQAAMDEMRTYTGDLERLVDSLKKTAFKQDTAIRLLADFTGAIVPGYRQ